MGHSQRPGMDLHTVAATLNLLIFYNWMTPMHRRNFIKQTGVMASAALSGSSLLASPTAVKIPIGKAEHVIFLWLGGGMSQIDTFDPKRRGNSKASPKLSGSEYESIDTGLDVSFHSFENLVYEEFRFFVVFPFCLAPFHR